MVIRLILLSARVRSPAYRKAGKMQAQKADFKAVKQGIDGKAGPNKGVILA
jgi:hypothetical protein